MDYLKYIQYNSVVTLSYFFICLIIQIINGLSRNEFSTKYLTCSRYRITDVRFYTGVLTHAIAHGDWDHFINNMTILLLLGPSVEERYGSIPFLIMLLITTVLVGYINMVITSKSIYGASSNTSMLIVLASFASASQGKIPLTVILICLIYFVREIKRILKRDGSYHVGHIMGYICGLVFGFYFMK